MSTLFFRNRRLLLLAIAVGMVAGASAFVTLPRLEDPALTPRHAIVLTRVPGATAERVEAMVTEKIEDELAELSDIDSIRSISRPGISLVTVELKGSVVEPSPIWSKVRDRLAEVSPEFPKEALPPELDEERGANAYTMVAALRWELPDEPRLGLLNRFAEELKDRLQEVPGTDYVELVGEPEEQIRVTVDPDELLELNLTAEQVAAAIERADPKVAAGALRSSKGNRLIEVSGELDALTRIAQVPLVESVDGTILRVGTIAKIDRVPEDPPRELAIVDGKPSIAVAVRMIEDQRVDHWAADARSTIEAFREELPDGIDLDLMFDQSHYTTERLDSLGVNLLVGALSVVAVVFVMMGWRSAILVASALPLSIAITLAGLMVLRIPLHQMSITGLIIALGLLIDNAIVVVDEINVKRASGASAFEAIRETVQHLWVPLLGSTLTTVLAFMPIVLLTGDIGEFVGPMGISVVLALVSSLFVSLSIIPALSGLLGGANRVQRTRRWWRDGFSIPFLVKPIRSFVTILVRRPLLGLSVALTLPIIGFLRAGELRDQFFPPADRDQFMIQFRLPGSVSIKETKSRLDEITASIGSHEGVDRIDWFVGQSAPTVYYNMLNNEDQTPSYAQAIVRADSADRALDLIRSLELELPTEFPNAQLIVRAFGQGPPFDAPIEIHLFGPSLERLRLYGEELRKILATVPEVEHTRATLDGGSPKLRLEADEDEVNLVGLTLTEIAGQLQANLEGVIGGSILEEVEELPVLVRVSNERRIELDRIASLSFVSEETEDWIPLDIIGSLELEPEHSRITHREGRRCNSIQGFLRVDALPAEVLADFRTRLDQSGWELPPGYELEFGGEEEEQGEAMGSLFASINILVALMVATLVLSFNSFRMAGLIGGVGIASVGLGILAIWISGYPFGFMAIIGTAGLIGVALNDSIVVLAAIRAHPTARAGDPSAIAEVVLGSARHVLATTFTTIAGFMPLLLDGGGFWPPLAVVVAGGVSGATLLALLYIPSGYAGILLIARQFSGLRSRARCANPTTVSEQPESTVESPGFRPVRIPLELASVD